MTFAYTFFLNVTFDPSREYTSFSDGYKPGAIMKNVYTGEVEASNHLSACGKLFETFNIDHPADYSNRSMSVGDVIMLTEGVTVRFFAVAGVGFTEIGDPSLQPVNPDYCTMDDYFTNQTIYEQYRRSGTTSLFVPYLQTVKAMQPAVSRG